MSPGRGRARGICSDPAYLTKGNFNEYQHPLRDYPRYSSRHYPRSGRDYDRGPSKGTYRERRAVPARPRDRGHRPGIHFQSYEEERTWIEERRNKRRERKSLFDLQPTDEQIALEELQKAALASHGPNPNVFLRPEERPGFGPSSSLQPQQTRHARRLYIGQLSPELSEEEIHFFFRESIHTALGTSNSNLQEDPILNVYINHERHFAFIEFMTIDICTACLSLNGINVGNKGKVIIKRPNDYNAAIAPPSNVDFLKKFDVSQLGVISPVVPDSPNKIFIGGLPYHLNDDQVMELLSAFGKIKAFHLVKSDAGASASKGYCFVEYVEGSHRDVAVMGLNGMDMGAGKCLTAKIASERLEGEGMEIGTAAVNGPMTSTTTSSFNGLSSTLGVSTAPPIMKHVDGLDIEELVDIAMGKTSETHCGNGSSASSNGILDIANAALHAAFGTSHVSDLQVGTVASTRILVLENMVTDDDFTSNEDYETLKDEVREECEKFGTLVSMKIPHPTENLPSSALKKIFLEYETLEDAAIALRELSGRQFGNNVIKSTFFNEIEYSSGKLS